MTVRSIWTGTLGFGMTVIPVRLGTVASAEDKLLHRVRRADGSRIRQQNVAEADGKPVDWSDVAMGYEAGDGRVVLVEDSDFDLAYGAKNRNAKILAFTPAGGLPRTAHEASYYVQPGAGGERAYELLATAMRRTGKVAVVSIAIRQREALGMLYPTDDGYLVLERLQWGANVKKPDFAAPSTGITENGIELAENLVGLMTGTFAWEAFTDTSAQALADVIRAKAETGQLVGSPVARVPGSTTAPADLEETLRASVEAAKAALAPQAPARRPRARKTASAAA